MTRLVSKLNSNDAQFVTARIGLYRRGRTILSHGEETASAVTLASEAKVPVFAPPRRAEPMRRSTTWPMRRGHTSKLANDSPKKLVARCWDQAAKMPNKNKDQPCEHYVPPKRMQKSSPNHARGSRTESEEAVLSMSQAPAVRTPESQHQAAKMPPASEPAASQPASQPAS